MIWRIGSCLNMLAAQGGSGIGDEWIEAAAALGFDYVELPLAECMALDEAALATLQKTLSDIPCEVMNNFFPKTMRLTGNEADLEAALDYTERALARAAVLGAKVVVFGSGPAKHVPEGHALEDGYRQVVRLLQGIGPLAEHAGITIVIEPLRKPECNLINSYREGTILAADVNHPHVMCLVDFYHLTFENEPLEHVESAARWLSHVHFAHPGERTYPRMQHRAVYLPFLKMLREKGYAGRISIEAYSRDFMRDAREALAVLKQPLDS